MGLAPGRMRIDGITALIIRTVVGGEGAACRGSMSRGASAMGSSSLPVSSLPVRRGMSLSQAGLSLQRTAWMQLLPALLLLR